MNQQLNGVTIAWVIGDLLMAQVDGIVISATPNLSLETEIGQQVLERGGNSILHELQALGRCEMGEVVLTSGGDLPAKFIIHAVGPIMGSGGERGKLSGAVWNALKLAEKTGLSNLAFSPISIGKFGYPVEACADIMAQKIIDFTFEDLKTLQQITLYLANERHYQIFESALNREIAIAQNEVS